MMHRIELRTTISPTPYFFRRIHFLAASLRALGGELTDHEIVVSVGGGEDDANYYLTQPWSRHYPIIWRVVPSEAYGRLGYRATNLDRASHVARARHVMMVDADVIFLRDFSELLVDLDRSPAICGVMAHGSPFLRPPVLTPEYADRVKPGQPIDAYWALLTEHFETSPLSFEHTYSGWGATHGHPAPQYAPPYFNGGMVLGNADLMAQMCALFPQAEGAVNAVMETYFTPQLARTLACHKAGLPCRILPLRYNFPNDPAFDAAFPDEAEKTAILHYLRHTIVHRDNNFSNPDGVRRLVARTDLAGSNERLRRVVEGLHTVVLGEEVGELA